LKGFDETHPIQDVAFDSVTVNGRALSAADVKTHAFVQAVFIQP
jgi:hypothetical protein